MEIRVVTDYSNGSLRMIYAVLLLMISYCPYLFSFIVYKRLSSYSAGFNENLYLSFINGSYYYSFLDSSSQSTTALNFLLDEGDKCNLSVF